MGETRWRAFAALLVAVVLVVIAGVATVGLLNRAPPHQTPQGSTVAAMPSTDAAVLPTDGSAPTAPTGPTTSATPSSAPSSGPSPSARPPTKVPPPTSVEPAQLTGYVWPLRNAWITSRFAPRDFGGFVVIDGREVHDGLDLATRCGDKVRAAHDGIVLYAGRNFDVFLGYWGEAERIYARYQQQGRINSLPIVVVVDDGNGYRSLYVHLSKALVEAGNVVKAGEIIAIEGATGFATGCHLHYGLIRMDGPWQEVVPSLQRVDYPPMVRERINPMHLFAWDDEFAPAVLRRRVGAGTSPEPTSGPGVSPGASGPTSPGPGATVRPSTGPSAAPGPSGTH